MAMSYEQWEIILGIVDQKADLSEDNVIEKIKELLKEVKILWQAETSRMLEEISHELEISSNIPRVQETQEPLKKRLKEESRSVYEEWEEAIFDVNHWFTVNCSNECFLYTLLYLAIDFKLNNVINAMLEVKDININAKSPFSAWSALHWAVEKGNIEVTLKLLQKGAEVNQLDSSERTALHWATEKGDIEITEILVQNKADVNAEDLARLTALYEAARNGHKEVVKILMKNGADAKRNGTLKLTPLHIAVANNNKEMVVCLIKMDKNISENIEAVDVFGWTPLYWAAARNNTSILESLLQAISQYRASVDIEDKLIGRSPLHIAATNDNVEAVELLISYGANINYKDVWGWTPFNCAAARGNIEVMNCLIANGANIETNDPQKILFSIHPYNFLKAVNTMIQLEICKDVIKLMGTEFLRCAARHGDTLMVHALLEAGVNANADDDLGSTALHQAAKYNHPEVVRILILYGVDVNAQDSSGQSPLAYAVERRHWIVVMTLLCYRANTSLPDHCGETVRDLAERQGISNLLVEAEQRAIAILTQLDLESSILRNKKLTTVQHIESHMLREIESHNLSISFERMIRDQANQIEQLQYQAKLNEKGVELITNTIKCLELESSTKMNGIKEQTPHSPCRWSYRTTNVNVGRVTPLANGIARMQLEPSTKMNGIKKQRYSPYRWSYRKNVTKKEVTNLANDIKDMNLQPSTYFSEIKKLSLLSSSLLSSSVIKRYCDVIESSPSFSSLR